MSRSRYRIFETEHLYFITCTIVARLPVFAYPRFTAIVLDSWRFLQRERSVQIFGYVILENHLHSLARCPDLSEQVGRFKSYTARCIIDSMVESGFKTLLQELRFFKLHHKTDQAHQLWQEGSHPEQITSDDMMLQKLEYMHNNPIRRGYVDGPTHWRYSSARNYAGQTGLIDVCTDWR